MTPRRRLALFLTCALVIGAAGFAALRPHAVPLRLTNAHAVPVIGEPGALRLFITIENSGGPDRLIAANAPGAESVAIVAEGPSIPIPAASAPMLAADGAHLRMEGVATDLADGAILPVTLIFEHAGAMATRATLADPLARGEASELGLLSLGGICRVGPGEPAPQVSLSVTSDGDGWKVEAITDDFTFSEPITDMGHIPGYGHGHLYVNGTKLQRMYTPSARIGALLPGRYTVELTLNTNDHRAYVVEGHPVSATAQIEVPGE